MLDVVLEESSAQQRIEVAEEYLEWGLVTIPIVPESDGGKKAGVRWAEFQTREPTAAELIEWYESYPHADLAVVTGAQSGVVVVDCDSEEALAETLRLGHCAVHLVVYPQLVARWKGGQLTLFVHGWSNQPDSIR